MKIELIVAFFLIFLVGCDSGDGGQPKNQDDVSVQPIEKTDVNVFPVNDFILGQINAIKHSPVTLLKTITQSGVTDSSWVDRKKIDDLAKDFLSPAIDSAFLTQNFDGSSFEDLTINAVTFVYSIKENSQKSSNLQQVTVYVKKSSNRVDRIYMVKDLERNGQMQLTWKTDSWFTIRKIIGENFTEEKVLWNFGS